MSPDAYTLPQLSKLLDVQYRTLHSWVERGLLQPSVQQSSGTGVPNLFDQDDAVTACVLTDLRAAGVNFKLLTLAAERLRENKDALSRPAFLLLNGDVKIIFDAEAAAAAIEEESGLTLAYNNVTALQTRDAIASRT